MQKRKIVYMILLVLLVSVVLFFYNAFNGNPVSKFFATKVLEKYLEETYPDREFRIDEGFYNFKFSEYNFDVIEIGSSERNGQGPKTYEFTVAGFLKPFVNLDTIYTENLDEELMEKLASEAEAEIYQLLAKQINIVKMVEVRIECQKGEYPPDTSWHKDMKLEKPMYISVVLDATTGTKESIWEATKKLQTLLNKHGYKYDSVNMNANVFGDGVDYKDDGRGYLRFATSFEINTNLKLDDLKVFNQ